MNIHSTRNILVIQNNFDEIDKSIFFLLLWKENCSSWLRESLTGSAQRLLDTRTQNFLSYSNLTRTKHYSDRVVSSINSRNFRIISTIIQKQPARRYFRIIIANPDIFLKSWEESLLALIPLLFFIQHFPFLSDIMI